MFISPIKLRQYITKNVCTLYFVQFTRFRIKITLIVKIVVFENNVNVLEIQGTVWLQPLAKDRPR